ncbi:tryptophan-rich sensory protein [Nostoc ellipsosporum NOK]|nr:tryptophan-rich sensory protein [Nostoc ellipsosporum NOK]
MQKTKNLAMLCLLAIIAQIVLAYGTQSDLVNDSNVGDVSDRYDSFFTPAGFTFAIWGVIYTALLMFAVRHLVVAFTKPADHPGNVDMRKIGGWFVVNNLLTIGWLFVWTAGNVAVAAALILGQLITLIAMHAQLKIHQPDATVGSKVFTQFPLSIYLGWISIATIANLSIFLLSKNWDGAGVAAVNWARIMIGVAGLLSLFMIFARKNVFFGLVVVWALYGIISKRQARGNAEDQLVIQAAWIVLGIVAVCCLAQFIRNLAVAKRYRLTNSPFPQQHEPLK